MVNQYICTDIYTVAAGDTLYSIAQRYDADVGLLMRVNRIRNPYNLRIGTKLCIPGPADQTPAPLPEVNPNQPQDGADSSLQCQTIHIVKKGDSLYLIARQHGVSLEELIKANSQLDPYNLQIGMEICIPR